MSFSYSDGALHESAFSRAHAVRLVVLREHAAFATLMAVPSSSVLPLRTSSWKDVACCKELSWMKTSVIIERVMP